MLTTHYYNHSQLRDFHNKIHYDGSFIPSEDWIKHLPEAIIELIISFKFEKRGYVWWERVVMMKMLSGPMKLFHWELTHWHKRGYTVMWLKPTPSQKKRAGAFKASLRKWSSLRNGDDGPELTCHVGMFHSTDEIERVTGIVIYPVRPIVELSHLNITLKF